MRKAIVGLAFSCALFFVLVVNAYATGHKGAGFWFSADREVTRDCSTDGGAWKPCASPKSYRGLASGAHNFDTRANSKVPCAGSSYGLSPDNTAEQNRNAFISAVNGTSNDIVLSTPGDYRVDNDLPVDTTDFSGTIVLCEGARFVATESNKVFRFFDAQAVTLTNWHVHVPDTSEGGSNPNTVFNQGSDITVNGMYMEGAAGGGMVFYRTIRPTVLNGKAENTGRDGLHFANAQDAYVDGYESKHTGDDGLAFLNYENRPDQTGGYATNVSVVDAYKARGISVVGQRNVTIENFYVRGVHSSGVYVMEEDNNSYQTREPRDVTVRNGRVELAGTILKDGNQASHRNSYSYGSVGPNVSFENVESCKPSDQDVKKIVGSSEGLDKDASVTSLITDTNC